MAFALTPPSQAHLDITGADEKFPVRRIYCIGKNYVAHIIEMNADERDPPVIFMKPADAIVKNGGEIPYPVFTGNFHYECELVVALKSGGYNIPVSEASSHIYGYAVGLDMTRRDVQLEARDKGRPWEFGKSFALSAPIGCIHRSADIGHPKSGAITLTVNGQPRQSSDIDKLIWSVAECIAHLSTYEALEPGDLIMTGTPEGVNAVVAGDTMVGAIAGLDPVEVKVTP